MKRIDAIKEITKILTDELVICTLGFPARELYDLKDRAENFYMLGSMGLASSISLGVCIAASNRRVICIDGDGSILMNLGSLTTIANVSPSNLCLIIIDNGTYGSTGDQKTYTSMKTRLDLIAKGAGFDSIEVVEREEDIVPILSRNIPGCRFIVIKVNPGNAPVENIPLHPEQIKERFMRSLG